MRAKRGEGGDRSVAMCLICPKGTGIGKRKTKKQEQKIHKEMCEMKKMKKIAALILVLVMCLSLCACVNAMSEEKMDAFLIGIIASSGDSDEPKKVDNTGTSNVEASVDNKEEVKEEKNEFCVGETAELKGVSVTLVNVTESTGSQFNAPTDGNVFVLCEFEIANNSDKEITVSSMMSFEAYCDDYACTYSLTALMEKGNKNQLDGTVAAGKKFNGVVGYEVSADWKELEVRFTPDFWNGKDIVFVANK